MTLDQARFLRYDTKCNGGETQCVQDFFMSDKNIQTLDCGGGCTAQ